MPQSAIDFVCGLSKSLIEGFGEARKHGLGNEIVEGIEKSRKKLFTIGFAIALAGTGFFLTLWGIASAIDTMFTMHGLGFVLIGVLAILGGAAEYRR